MNAAIPRRPPAVLLIAGWFILASLPNVAELIPLTSRAIGGGYLGFLLVASAVGLALGRRWGWFASSGTAVLFLLMHIFAVVQAASVKPLAPIQRDMVQAGIYGIIVWSLLRRNTAAYFKVRSLWIPLIISAAFAWCGLAAVTVLYRLVG